MSAAPEVLYHYTSFDAFKKLMESEILRATHYSELNDWSEIKMGLNVVKSSLKKYQTDTPAETMEFLLERLALLKKAEWLSFVFSLSEAGNSLDQWRAYCPGGGVAIGFLAQNLDGHFRKESTKEKDGGWSCASWQMFQCQYLDPEDSIDLQTVISSANDLMKLQSQQAGQADHFADVLTYSQLMARCCSIKHRAYESEREWRCFETLSTRTPLEIRLDERNRRFVEMPFIAGDVIKEVVISPHGDNRQGKSLALYFRDSKNLTYDVAQSNIPFRQ